MANSRKPARSDPSRALTEAVAADLAQRLLSLQRPRIALACSGGRDSAVLLDVLARLRAEFGFELLAFHVHHGLSPQADAWAAHVEQQAATLGMQAQVVRVQVETAAQTGLEAAARAARYAALDRLCIAHEVGVLALAHHADDQAETVLLQLVRGAGLPGLAAMPRWLEGVPAARWRPLIEVERAAIDAYARARRIAFVDDESNAQLHLRRNAIRHTVLAPLREQLPQAAQAIGRSARHVQSALGLLREIGAADLERVRTARGLSIAGLAVLSDAHRVNALRTWIETLDIPAPSDARLAEIWRQMQVAGPAGTPQIAHAGGCFMRHRDTLAYVARADEILAQQQVPLVAECTGWPADGIWAIPAWRGAFHAVPAPVGIAEEQLRLGHWVARARSGGERLRIAANRPSRDLKHWYQTLGVAGWQRAGAPLLWLDDRLCCVPYVGMAVEQASSGSGRFAIEWRPDGTTLTVQPTRRPDRGAAVAHRA